MYDVIDSWETVILAFHRLISLTITSPGRLYAATVLPSDQPIPVCRNGSLTCGKRQLNGKSHFCLGLDNDVNRWEWNKDRYFPDSEELFR